MPATHTVGDGMAYSTIQDALDAIPGDLTGQGIQTVEVYAKAPSNRYDESPNASTGFTNQDAANYIEIISMVNHNGQRNQGIIIRPTALPTVIVRLGTRTRLTGCCVTMSGTKVGGSLFGMYMSSAPSCIIDKCILYNMNLNASPVDELMGCYMLNSNSVIIKNSVTCALSTTIGTSACFPVRWFNSDNCKIYNCSSVNSRAKAGRTCNTYHQSNGSNNLVVTNCYSERPLSGAGLLAFNLSVVLGIAINNSISSDNTAGLYGGAGNLINRAAANQFVSSAYNNEDVHLKAAADCLEAGANLAGSGVVDDFEGTVRPQGVNYDVGADEAGPTGIDLTNLSIGYERFRRNQVHV